MGRRFRVVLEHDGDNPIRNDYICKIDDDCFFHLRDWEDLYTSKLGNYPDKKISIRTKKLSDWYGYYCWDINKIIPQIEAIKQEMEIDTQLEEEDKKSLHDVIYDLQRLYDSAIEKCKQYGIDPEKCNLVWWIDY